MKKFKEWLNTIDQKLSKVPVAWIISAFGIQFLCIVLFECMMHGEETIEFIKSITDGGEMNGIQFGWMLGYSTVVYWIVISFGYLGKGVRLIVDRFKNK